MWRADVAAGLWRVAYAAMGGGLMWLLALSGVGTQSTDRVDVRIFVPEGFQFKRKRRSLPSVVVARSCVREHIEMRVLVPAASCLPLLVSAVVTQPYLQTSHLL